jgi:hypothetical protein
MIKPTIGRKVHFWPNGFMPAGLSAPIKHQMEYQPFDATVVYVWNDRMVNLRVTDHYGNSTGVTSIRLRQDDDPVPDGAYAEWMPYQVGQAAKTEQLEKQLAAN